MLEQDYFGPGHTSVATLAADNADDLKNTILTVAERSPLHRQSKLLLESTYTSA